MYSPYAVEERCKRPGPAGRGMPAIEGLPDRPQLRGEFYETSPRRLWRLGGPAKRTCMPLNTTSRSQRGHATVPVPVPGARPTLCLSMRGRSRGRRGRRKGLCFPQGCRRRVVSHQTARSEHSRAHCVLMLAPPRAEAAGAEARRQVRPRIWNNTGGPPRASRLALHWTWPIGPAAAARSAASWRATAVGCGRGPRTGRATNDPPGAHFSVEQVKTLRETAAGRHITGSQAPRSGAPSSVTLAAADPLRRRVKT